MLVSVAVAMPYPEEVAEVALPAEEVVAEVALPAEEAVAEGEKVDERHHKHRPQYTSGYTNNGGKFNLDSNSNSNIIV